MAEYDVIVVGAGIEGSCTANHLVDRGAKVLLLEQFDALHTRGSSHGGSRNTRRAYAQPYYVAMMDDAFRLWDRIETDGATKLYIRTGTLQIGPPNCKDIADTISNLKESGDGHQALSGKEVNERYPEQFNLPEDFLCVFENNGGILLADKAVSTIQNLFKSKGGKLLDNHRVTSIVPGSVVKVVTNEGNFEARQVVITAGAWSKKLLATLGVDLPLKVVEIEVLYWEVGKTGIFSADVFPTFGVYGEESFMFYSIPVQEYPGLIKIAQHDGVEVDPDQRIAVSSPISASKVAKFIESCLKSVSTTPSVYESCLYTKTPDDDPVLDRHPQYPNIIIGAGFSGHGFKLAPVIGKVLCELALNLPLSFDLTPFRLARLT